MSAPTPPTANAGALTELEHHVVDLTAKLWDALEQVVFPGPSRAQDLAEIALHIHAIQNAVLAQAAARAYPDRYRLLGQMLTPTRIEVLS